MRSLLLVGGGDRAAALACGADALVVDAAKAADYVGGPALYLRVGGLDEDGAAAALAAAAALRPRGVALAAAAGGDVQRLGARLAVEEALQGLPDGALRVLVFATETPGAIFGLSSYRGASGRLDGLAWTAAPLAAALRGSPGRTAGPLRLARDLTLFAARAAGVLALDAPFPDVEDLAGLREEALAARADGFDGKAAIDPAQVAVINAAFG